MIEAEQKTRNTVIYAHNIFTVDHEIANPRIQQNRKLRNTRALNN